MSQSKDIIILDNDDVKTDTNVISTNESKINLSEIFTETNNMNKNNEIIDKLPKLSKKDLKTVNKMEYVKNEINNVENKQNSIYIIQKYQSSELFGEYVRNELKVNYTEEALNKKSLIQLQTILSKIRLNLDNKNLNQMYDSVLFGSTMMVETLSKPIINVDGFSKMLKENPSFLSCWERFKCETVMPTIPSHIQMTFIILQTYFIAYTINKSNEPSDEVKEIISEIEIEIDEEKSNNEKEEVKEPPKIENGMNL